MAIATGIAIELGIEAVSGRGEAWDSEYYWMLGVPIAALISLLIGFIAERRDWLWAAAIVPSQVVTMMATSGDLGPDGLIMLPIMGVLASVLARRLSPRLVRRVEIPPAYCARSAVTGSTAIARRAGTAHASSDTAKSSAITDPSVIGSMAPTPYS